jgi:CheY-like chemotaxis protein
MAEAARSAINRRHVLVVEDDYNIAIDLARSLEDFGVSVLGPVASVADALALVARELAIDGAILDINLGVEKVFPLADCLRERGVPFVFATGYDHWIIPDAYADVPRFEKPVETFALARFLSE